MNTSLEDTEEAASLEALASLKGGLAELHCHLDGSLRASTFLELHQLEALPSGESQRVFCNENDVLEHLAFQEDWTLQRCLQSFSSTLLVLQSASNLERVVFELCEDLHKANVSYAEIRYCPSLHGQQGLTSDQVIDAVHTGLRRAERAYPSSTFNQIVTILRDLGPEEALNMAKLACRHGREKKVVGVDLAGDEFSHPPEQFVDAFDYVHSHDSKLGITIHAGEGDCIQAEKNIWTAIDRLHATRIGHGVAAKNSPELQSALCARNIPLEICPTSNVHTGAISHLSMHPVRQFLKAGIAVVPCSDNILLSKTTTPTEYVHLSQQCQLSKSELVEVAFAAHDYKFVN